MNKVELESRLEGLTDEINFLRQIHEEVRSRGAQGDSPQPVRALRWPRCSVTMGTVNLVIEAPPPTCGDREVKLPVPSPHKEATQPS